MADAWPWPTPKQQNTHMSSSSYHPNRAGHGQSVTQSEANPAARVQGSSCPCPLCSVTRESDQSTQRIIEGQDLWPSGASAVPSVNQNQGLGDATRIVAAMDDQTYVPFVSQQTQMTREDASYPPPQEAQGPLQVQTGTGLDQAQVLDMMPVTEGLRRLARRYVNNPESLVNAVQLEPAPSGRIQVVIMIEIAEIL